MFCWSSPRYKIGKTVFSYTQHCDDSWIPTLSTFICVKMKAAKKGGRLLVRSKDNNLVIYFDISCSKSRFQFLQRWVCQWFRLLRESHRLDATPITSLQDFYRCVNVDAESPTPDARSTCVPVCASASTQRSSLLLTVNCFCFILSLFHPFLWNYA